MADKHPPYSRSRAWRWVAALIFVVATLGAWSAWKNVGADPEQIRREADLDILSGRYEHAAAALLRLNNPTSRDYILKARVAKALNDHDVALVHLSQIADGDPAAPQARLLTGQIELKLDRMRLAEKALLAALELDPTLVEAHRQLIFIYGMQLRRHELNEHFQALSRMGPMTFGDVFNWCLTRNTVWEPHEHIEDLRRYIAADATDRWSRVALAEAIRQIGRREEATSVIAVLPESDPEARAVRARIALERGDDRVVAALLAEGPIGHPELARLRGRFALAHRDGPAAVRHFRAAYAAEPDSRDTVFGLGTALALVGDPAAEPFLRDSKSYDTLGALMTRAANPANHHDPALIRALGAACEAVRRIPEARAWYNLAVEINALDDESQKALHRLKSR